MDSRVWRARRLMVKGETQEETRKRVLAEIKDKLDSIDAMIEVNNRLPHPEPIGDYFAWATFSLAFRVAGLDWLDGREFAEKVATRVRARLAAYPAALKKFNETLTVDRVTGRLKADGPVR
jgi:hypothetical protein